MGTTKGRAECKVLEVCDPCHALSLLHKAWQGKSKAVQVNAERLYTLAHDAFYLT